MIAYVTVCSIMAFPLALIATAWGYDHAPQVLAWWRTLPQRRADHRWAAEHNWRRLHLVAVWAPATVAFPCDPSPRPRP